MTILLDTHCWLWMLLHPKRLGERARALLLDQDNELFLSAASSWEIAIKYTLGKIPLPMPPMQYVTSRLAKTGVRGLSIEHRHVLHVADLPLHHHDPFDRLLVAQAQLENLKLMTSDKKLSPYDVSIIPAA